MNTNKRNRKSDGGAVLKLSLTKSAGECKISDLGYYLAWVNKPYENGKVKFEVKPCIYHESGSDTILSTVSKEKMNEFLSDSRSLLEKENRYVEEIKEMVVPFK